MSDHEDEEFEELQNDEPSLFIDMPNSIKQLRVRDTKTGQFVRGSASLLAAQFKRDADAHERG